jgi:hypothetical protein
MGVSAHKLLDIRTELASRGFWFDPNDRSWRNKAGALMSEEGIDDVQRLFGLVTVAKLLDAIDDGALEWDLDVHADCDDPLATKITLRVVKKTLLDKMAKI